MSYENLRDKFIESVISEEGIYNNETAEDNKEVTSNKIINVTPHAISIYNKEGTEVLTVLQPSETIARVSVNTNSKGSLSFDNNGEIFELDIAEQTMGDLTGLPEEQPGVYYYCSILAFNEAKELGRKDCLAGNEYVRESGNIIGIKSFLISG